MQTRTPSLVKTNQHYQLTIPRDVRAKISIKQGTLFTVAITAEGILFRPLEFKNNHTVEYADPLDTEETKEIKAALKDIKEGKYHTVTTDKELREHLESLK